MLSLGTLATAWVPWGSTFITGTSDCGAGGLGGLSRIVLTTEKMAVFAPMPTARMTMAVTVKPGVLASDRRPNLRSRHKSSSQVEGAREESSVMNASGAFVRTLSENPSPLYQETSLNI